MTSTAAGSRFAVWVPRLNSGTPKKIFAQLNNIFESWTMLVCVEKFICNANIFLLCWMIFRLHRNVFGWWRIFLGNWRIFLKSWRIYLRSSRLYLWCWKDFMEYSKILVLWGIFFRAEEFIGCWRIFLGSWRIFIELKEFFSSPKNFC